MGEEGSETVNEAPAAAAFGFKVSIRATSDTLLVECRWLEGHNPKLFESFTGYMEETAKASLKNQGKESGHSVIFTCKAQ
jgi:23S rRNA (adenine1618-N6)-methyltransferase